MRKIFHKLLSIEEAKKIIWESIQPKPIGIENIEITNANGRILAEDIYAPIDLPPFDRSKMDGFAVIAEDTYYADEDNPITLKVIDEIEPGETPKKEVKKGTAIEISTGAPIPPGANAVIMVEYTEKDGDKVKIYRAAAIGENIVFTGSDITIGQKILRKGETLGRIEIGVLAAMGIKRIKVYKKPRIAIISTGNELTSPGRSLEPYRIYDTNTYSIANAVLEIGGKPLIYGPIKDEEEKIKEILIRTQKETDLTLISGGTSAGIGDLVYRVINKLGEPGIIIHGIKIKPGKPTIVAIIDEKPIIGLPGWPVSSLMIFNLIVEPIIRRILGKKEEEKERERMKIAKRIIPSKGRTNLIPISIIYMIRMKQ